MAYGWTGKRLRVDLTKGQTTVENIPPKFREKWLGGRGFNAAVLYDEVGPDVEPFDPANRLIFGVGPLTGTFAPCSGRTTITARSPLQYPNGIGDSNMGGHFAPELKFAGYDQVVIQGKAEHPVYLWINDDKVEIRDARHLWGKNPAQTDAAIKEETGNRDIQISLIGKAGENLVRYGAIFNSISRAAARLGMGAVMGSKNLKAVAVRGTKPVNIANPTEFYKVCERLYKKMKDDIMVQGLNQFGSMLLVMPANYEHGWFCWQNFQKGNHPDAHQISGEVHVRKYLAHREGCFACPICCGRYSKINHGKYAGEEGGGPEYETLTAVGPRLGVLDFPSAIHNSLKVNELGMDSCSAGGAIAWAMEAWQKGLIGPEETGGLNLEWGNQEVIDKLFDMIANREGFGDILAEGSYRSAKHFGVGEEFTMTVKGQDMSQDDPRGLGFAFGIGFATGRRGGDHLQALPCLELTGQFYPGLVERITGSKEAEQRLTPVKKPEMQRYQEEIKALGDCLTQCTFAHSWSFAVLPEDMVELLNTATGGNYSEQDLRDMAARVIQLERAYWNRLLVGKMEDKNPVRFTKEPMPDGPNKGTVFPEDELLPRYYELRGWEADTGFPKEEVLAELGLENVAKELQPYREQYREKVTAGSAPKENNKGEKKKAK